jgi:chemotaxis protein methyltransferase WspC
MAEAFALSGIQTLLKAAMGLDASSLGPSAIQRAVDARRRASGAADTAAYLQLLRDDARELQALVESVVVPETWFLRDPEAFATLADVVAQRLRDTPLRPLRLLSLPCSSGEEPFSMAMALLDAGVDAHQFRIEAVDISEIAVEAAQRASYGPNSFRSAELGFRDRHFRASGEQRWTPSDRVRACVTFTTGNLLAPGFLPGEGHYDAIFCRNVLIYFDPDTQVRAVEVLTRLLAPDGWLFVGPSETGLLPRQKFASAQRPMAFAFRRQAARAVPRAAKAGASNAPSEKAGVAGSSTSAPPSARRASVMAPSRQRAARVVDHELRRSQALADQGKLAEAASACEQHLRDQGASADAYCLLGLIREAAGDKAAAAALFRKALYLDPRHAESLGHLALLLERKGDANGARLLRERLRRLDQAVT